VTRALAIAVALLASSLASADCPAITVHADPHLCFGRTTPRLSRFEVCGKTATFCTTDTESASEACYAVDLDRGTYRSAELQPIAAPSARVETKGNVVSVCIHSRCVATDLPASESPFQIDTNDDGTRAVVTVDVANTDVVVIDTKTGKRTRTVKLPMKLGDQLGPAYFLGDKLLALVGYFPLERGVLVDPDGATHALDLDVHRGKPIALGHDHWAMATIEGGGITVLDARSAAHTSSKAPSDLSRACISCLAAETDPALATARLARSAAGALVSISGLGVATVDARSLATVQTFPLPRCAVARP
jgi:hypothetical protein